MKSHIGTQIKNLRKSKNMTQEQLAELLGISFQAVSKWENNITLPDITLVPTLAKIFGVSTDTLFAYNLQEIQEEIDKYLEDAFNVRETNPYEGRRILEEALEKYPENDILLNNLLYVIDYNEKPDETIKIASKLIDNTTMSDVKYDALRFLAYAYNAKGDTDSAVSALEQIPEIYFTKLAEMASILDGHAKYEAAEKQKWISFEILLQMLTKIAEFYESERKYNNAIAEFEKALALIVAMDGEEKIGNFDGYVEFFEGEIGRLKLLK